ncbi:MAG: hypothetical protein ACI3T9_06165 [Romboutsia timonensis]
MKNALATLIYQNYKNDIPSKFANVTASERDAAIREEFFNVLGLTEGYSKRAFRNAWRNHKNEVYAITEEIAIQLLNNGDLEKDSFFNNFVEVRNLALGDSVEFVVEAENEIEFAEFSGSHMNLRRQRIENYGVFVPEMREYGIKVYTYWEQVAAGRISFDVLVNKIAVAMNKKLAEIAQATFAEALNNLPTEFKVATGGTIVEDDILEMLAHVEAANGVKPMLVGTEPALRKLTGVITLDRYSSNMKDAVNENGLLSVWNGYMLMPIKQGHKIGTFEFTMDNEVIYALCGGEKPVKLALEGDVIVKEVSDGLTNADMSLEQAVSFKAGCGVQYNKLFGLIELS